MIRRFEADFLFWSGLSSILSSAANWLKPPDLEQKKQHHTPRYLTRAYWHNNCRKLLFLCTYAFFSLLLFVSAMLQHSYGGGWYMVAKGCGQCLNFNCTFIMVRASTHFPNASLTRNQLSKPFSSCSECFIIQFVTETRDI